MCTDTSNQNTSPRTAVTFQRAVLFTRIYIYRMIRCTSLSPRTKAESRCESRSNGTWSTLCCRVSREEVVSVEHEACAILQSAPYRSGDMSKLITEIELFISRSRIGTVVRCSTKAAFHSVSLRHRIRHVFGKL